MDTNSIKIEVPEGVVNPIFLSKDDMLNEDNLKATKRLWKEVWQRTRIDADIEKESRYEISASHLMCSIMKAIQGAIDKGWYNISIGTIRSITCLDSSFEIFVHGNELESADECKKRFADALEGAKRLKIRIEEQVKYLPQESQDCDKTIAELESLIESLALSNENR